MSEVAAGYVSIVPKFGGGFKKGIVNELGGATDQVEKRGSASFGRLFGGVGKLAAVAAGAVTTAFGAAKVFGGGMSRLMGIEEAQAKLRGLGNDTEAVEVIMGNALASVKGTSFGMAEAATTAAGAVAAGVKPGEDLERMLKAVSNSAAAAGTGMGEMGSLFNKVATVDMAQMDVLNQVSDRGIPIMQKLAEHLGVTTDEVRKMASAGEIGFAEFEAAMVAASGTVAEEMGGTLRGSIANLNSSLGRIGANFLEGVFPLLAPAIQKLTEWLGGVEGGAKGVGKAFGEWLTGSAIPAITGVVDAIKPIAGALSEAFSGAGGGFDGILAAAQAAVGMVVDWLADGGLVMIAQTFIQGKAKLLEAALQLFPAILEAVQTVLPQVVGMITALLPGLVETVVGMLGGLIDALVTVLPALIDTVVALLPMIIDAILGLLPVIIEAAITLFMGLVDGLITAFPVIIEALVGALPLIIDALLSAIPQLITAAITLFLAIIDGLLKAFPTIIQSLIGALPRILQTVLGFLPQLVQAAITLFLGLITGLLKALPDILSALIGILPDLISTLLQMIPEIIGAGVEIFLGLVEGLMNAWPEISAALSDVSNRIMDSFSGAGTWLKESGKKVIQGLVDGIKGMVSKVKNAVGDVLQAARNLLPFSPAKEGPFSGKGWTLYSGRSIVEGLAEGVGDRRAALQRALDGVLSGAKATLDVGIAGGRAGQSGRPVVQNFTLQIPDWVRDLDDLLSFLRLLGLQAHQMGG